MKLVIFTDGGCRANSAKDPGPASCAFVAYDGDGRYVASMNETFIGTNNVAEYRGLLLAAKNLPALFDFLAITDEYVGTVEFKADSKLLVNQMNADWACQDKALMGLRASIFKHLIPLRRKTFFSLLGEHGVTRPRDENQEADYLCNLALDGTLITDMFAPLRIKIKAQRGISTGQLFKAGRLNDPKPMRVDQEGYALCSGCQSRLVRCKCPPLKEASIGSNDV